jgi:hypothetical protein
MLFFVGIAMPAVAIFLPINGKTGLVCRSFFYFWGPWWIAQQSNLRLFILQ